MVYRIKVEAMQDGSGKYYPMVRQHWWSSWKLIKDIGADYGFGCKTPVPTLEIALDIINSFGKHVVSRTYYIPYKENEQ